MASPKKFKAVFEIYQDDAKEWRFRLRHKNGNILLDSAEGYSRKHDCEKALAQLRVLVGEAGVAKA